LKHIHSTTQNFGHLLIESDGKMIILVCVCFYINVSIQFNKADQTERQTRQQNVQRQSCEEKQSLKTINI